MESRLRTIGIKLIPLSPFRLDIFRLLRIFLYFYPQLPDMYHYRAVAGVKIGFVPDTFIQVLGGKNLSRMLHHQKKHLVFDIGKLFFLSV